MRYKMFSLFTMVLALSLFYSNVEATARFDTDIGSKLKVKIMSFDGNDGVFVFHYVPAVAMFEATAVLPWNTYVRDTYLAPKTANDRSIWNARINHNYPFQLPNKASPSLMAFPLLE